MSRTYRKYIDYMFRRPKGRMRAIYNNARSGAIPPDPYEDIPLNKEVNRPWNVAEKLFKRGLSRQEVANKIHKRFRIPKYQAVQIAYGALRFSNYRYDYRIKPPM